MKTVQITKSFFMRLVQTGSLRRLRHLTYFINLSIAFSLNKKMKKIKFLLKIPVLIVVEIVENDETQLFERHYIRNPPTPKASI